MGKKLLISALVLLFLGAILTVVWEGLDWPPPRLLLKYGAGPGVQRTGRTLKLDGLRFIEVLPGYDGVLKLSRAGQTPWCKAWLALMRSDPQSAKWSLRTQWCELPYRTWMALLDPRSLPSTDRRRSCLTDWPRIEPHPDCLMHAAPTFGEQIEPVPADQFSAAFLALADNSARGKKLLTGGLSACKIEFIIVNGSPLIHSFAKNNLCLL
jgi:hypothetical protein